MNEIQEYKANNPTFVKIDILFTPENTKTAGWLLEAGLKNIKIAGAGGVYNAKSIACVCRPKRCFGIRVNAKIIVSNFNRTGRAQIA